MRDVVKIGDAPVAKGGFADVWEGSLRGHHIAIKEVRVNAMGLSGILKVRLYSGMMTTADLWMK